MLTVKSTVMSLIFGEKDKLKKEELIRSTQTLHHYVHKYFTVTNRLLEIMKTHLEQSPSPAVQPDEQESIEKNCARVADAMLKIYDVSEREDKHVRKSIDSSLYDKITFPVVSLKDKAALIKEIHQETLGLLGNVLGPLVVVQLAHSDLTSLTPAVKQEEFSPVLSLALGDLVQSSETIAKCLSGPESHQKSLDESVALVEGVISVLKPPCDSYNDILCEVEAYVTIISENMES